MPKPYTTLVGKAVRGAMRLRGGGSALPGLVVEKIDPDFVGETLATLPRGVIVVSGTNGKTTTTKIVTELLESQGLKVFTNRTGSNFVRGVAAALLGEVDRRGNLDADIAVLELDEAHAVKFVETIKPRYSLLLNIMRDQLDRFGETDTTARMLHAIAENTTDAIIVNRDDPHLGAASFIDSLNTTEIRSYGVHSDLQKEFPSDTDMHDVSPATPREATFLAHDTSLESLESDAGITTASIAWDTKNHTASLQLSGIYNVLNATAAIALVRAVMNDELDEKAMLAALSHVKPAFGRGEIIEIGGQPCELVLVKNPAGFRLGLKSYDSTNVATMVAINDHYADGRDMSWLWDIEFNEYFAPRIAALTGIRAYDMALRLQYDDVEIETITPDIEHALKDFLHHHATVPKRIFCTYTAMLHIRKSLKNHAELEEINA